jgi:hypothetical protein
MIRIAHRLPAQRRARHSVEERLIIAESRGSCFAHAAITMPAVRRPSR